MSTHAAQHLFPPVLSPGGASGFWGYSACAADPVLGHSGFVGSLWPLRFSVERGGTYSPRNQSYVKGGRAIPSHAHRHEPLAHPLGPRSHLALGTQGFRLLWLDLDVGLVRLGRTLGAPWAMGVTLRVPVPLGPGVVPRAAVGSDHGTTL